jgi:hypothetical protein
MEERELSSGFWPEQGALEKIQQMVLSDLGAREDLAEVLLLLPDRVGQGELP